MDLNAAALTEKIRTLSPEQVIEVENFVEFLRLRDRDRELTRISAGATVPAFEAVWANPEDDVYDAL